MIGRRHNDGRDDPDAPARARFARAAELAGFTVKKWKNPRTLEVHDRNPRGPHKLRLDLHALTAAADEPHQHAQEHEPLALAAGLCVALDRPAPDELLRSPRHLRHLLRPRLEDPASLKGLNKAAVRRDAAAGLIYTVSVGPNPAARRIRTAELDAWNASFDDILQTATEQLAERITPDHTHLVEDTDALHAIVHETEPTACAHRFLDRLLPGFEPDNGALFAIPASRTLLALPVNHTAGAAGLAALVQSAFVLTPPTDPRQGAVYWALNNTLQPLPLTRVTEDPQDHGRTTPAREHDDPAASRVQLDLTDAVRELLEKLGTDPGNAQSD